MPRRSKVRFAHNPLAVLRLGDFSHRSLAPPLPQKVTLTAAMPLHARASRLRFATNFLRLRLRRGKPEQYPYDQQLGQNTSCPNVACLTGYDPVFLLVRSRKALFQEVQRVQINADETALCIVYHATFCGKNTDYGAACSSVLNECLISAEPTFFILKMNRRSGGSI